MPPNLGDGDPSRDVDVEAGSHEVFDFRRESNFGSRHLADLCRLGVREGAFPCDEDREQNSE